MDALEIQGGISLTGNVSIEGAKNALLPLMAASLLTNEAVRLDNAPYLADTAMMIALLQRLGCHVSYDQIHKKLDIHAKSLTTFEAPYDYVRKMRASILVLAPLLSRLGEAKVSLPGGCAIGVRPVDLHIEALRTLGATIDLEGGCLHAKAPAGLKGGHYRFPKVSVTGTANMLMAATRAQGDSCIENAACEPDIDDLIKCLQSMGAKIDRQGRTLYVTGVSHLSSTQHKTVADRIEAGTYILAAVITGGELILKNATCSLLPTFIKTLKEMGAHIIDTPAGIRVSSPGPYDLKPANIVTGPYPEFPTDLQAQMTALLTLVPGQSTVKETIFENRFMHVAELMRMDACLQISAHTVSINGKKTLKPAPLMATDLRASACLVLAALAAKGTSTIKRIYHLDRGYLHMEKKLSACGAIIQRLRGDDATETIESPITHAVFSA